MRTGRNTVRASSKGKLDIKKEYEVNGWIQLTDKNDAPLVRASKHLKPDTEFSSGNYVEGINSSSWKSFCLGKFCSLHIFQAYCSSLGIRWEDVIDWEAVSDTMLFNFDIPFTSSNNSRVLNSGFQWYQGDFTNNKYKLTKEASLIISASGGSDHFESKDSAPMITYPVEGDFEAEIKIKFSPQRYFQRAGFGIRSVSNRLNYLRIYLLEPERIEPKQLQPIRIEILKNNPARHLSKLENYKSDTVYFKIERIGKGFSMSYSADRDDWVNLLSKYRYTEISQNAELFFNVLSTPSSYKAKAEFSNFTMKLPKREFLKKFYSQT